MLLGFGDVVLPWRKKRPISRRKTGLLHAFDGRCRALGVRGLICASLNYLPRRGFHPLDPSSITLFLAMHPANQDRPAPRGPKPLPVQDLREHCVSVRLNQSELLRLDGLRGPLQRGAWLRLAALERAKIPSQVPEINRQAWSDLAKLSANLNQAQAAVNSGLQSPYPDELFTELRESVRKLRQALLGLESQ